MSDPTPSADVVIPANAKLCFESATGGYRECLTYSTIHEITGKDDSFPTGGLIFAVTVLLLAIIVGVFVTQEMRNSHKRELAEIDLQRAKLQLERDKAFARAAEGP